MVGQFPGTPAQLAQPPGRRPRGVGDLGLWSPASRAALAQARVSATSVATTSKGVGPLGQALAAPERALGGAARPKGIFVCDGGRPALAHLRLGRPPQPRGLGARCLRRGSGSGHRRQGTTWSRMIRVSATLSWSPWRLFVQSNGTGIRRAGHRRPAPGPPLGGCPNDEWLATSPADGRPKRWPAGVERGLGAQS